MNNIVLNLATLAGVSVGLSTVVSKAFNVADRYTPIMDLVEAVILSLLFVGLTRDAAILGIIAGLTASGAVSGATTFGSKNPSNTLSQ